MARINADHFTGNKRIQSALANSIAFCNSIILAFYHSNPRFSKGSRMARINADYVLQTLLQNPPLNLRARQRNRQNLSPKHLFSH